VLNIDAAVEGEDDMWVVFSQYFVGGQPRRRYME